jgi:hypothetical protein
MSEEHARFEQLRDRAKALGWDLIHRNDPETGPWGYVLRRLGTTANVATDSAARLDPEDPDDPLTGLDSVSHVLDQIEEIERQKNA